MFVSLVRLGLRPINKKKNAFNMGQSESTTVLNTWEKRRLNKLHR